jgi:hypothetical protein
MRKYLAVYVNKVQLAGGLQGSGGAGSFQFHF